MSQTQDITVRVNGEQLQVSIPVRMNLVDFLREQLGLTGSHVGCEQGVCGACTVAMDGVMVRGCLLLAVQADGASITTIEAFSKHATGEALQQSFVDHNALQCGYCTPGMLASAIEYVDAGGSTDRCRIREHLSGNYCRCTGYQSIVDAIVTVVEHKQRSSESFSLEEGAQQ